MDLSSSLTLKVFVLSDFEENCYLLFNKERRDCIIIDPGAYPLELIEFIKDSSLTPLGILITHAHWDHIAGLESLTSKWPSLPAYVGRYDLEALADPEKNLSLFINSPVSLSLSDFHTVKDQDEALFGAYHFKVYETPGHTQGHVVYQIQAPNSELWVFSGDLIFLGSVGRTDLFGGSHQQLLDSIRRKILSLPDNTILYPGHGAPTTVYQEKKHNIFLN